MKKTPLLIIAGPTASGKSDTAVELAIRMNGEVISADSMQVYRGMDVGSAKITQDQMRGLRRALRDVECRALSGGGPKSPRGNRQKGKAPYSLRRDGLLYPGPSL